MSLAHPLPPIQDRKYIPALDGIRGLALILVITFHYFGQYFAIFSLGWTGLDLFFVLSGYLITGRIVENENRKNRYGVFYKNRALRILPLYYLVLIIYYFAIFFIISPENFHRFDFYLDNWAGFVFFFQNWSYIFSEPPIEVHLAHLWSLAVEEQFYLLWPLIVYSFYKRRYFIPLLWGAVVAVLVYRCILHVYFGPPDPYYAFNYNTFCRLDGLIIGAITFFVLYTRPVKNHWILFIAGISTILFIAGLAITQRVSHTSFFVVTVGYTALSFIFAGVIYLINIKPGSYIDRFFTSSFLRHIGKVSYGFYVAHWPVLVILADKITLLMQNYFHMPAAIAKGCTLLLCMALSYLFALVSFNYFERYFLQKKHKPQPG